MDESRRRLFCILTQMLQETFNETEVHTSISAQNLKKVKVITNILFVLFFCILNNFFIFLLYFN